MPPNPYPKITVKAWTTLRARAAVAPSTRFTSATVASLMDLSLSNARDNAVSPMRRLGLIDDEGVLTARGNKWRGDSSFGEACQEMLDEIYPDELGALIGDDDSPDTAQVRTWFGHQGFGKANAQQMAGTYIRIASKQIPELSGTDSGTVKQKAPPEKKAAENSPEPMESDKDHEIPTHGSPPSPVTPETRPTVHLDIQVHIPADATPDKIDQIFSSMARHLYSK